jgi:hypothetical protein
LFIAVLGSAGCDNDIDPDTLVRELRILGMRFGDFTPGSAAEMQATVGLSGGSVSLTFTQPSIQMAVLAAAPTGPGRRITSAGPRPLRYDWFACVGPLSLFSPGTVDPQCLKFGPSDPPARQNPSLRPLAAAGAAPTDGTLVLQASDLQSIFAPFFDAQLKGGSGGSGGSGGGMVDLTRPQTLLLPILVEVSVPSPAGDPNSSLDREVGYSFLRIIIALPGMTLPPPNHNPTLQMDGAVLAAADEMDVLSGKGTRLVPCSQPSAGDCSRFPVSRTQPIFFSGRATMESAESYVPLDDSGRTSATEVLRYAWFSTDGTFSDERTGDSHPQTKWENGDKRPAPPETSVADMWIVVQDERGGADFQRFQLLFQ